MTLWRSHEDLTCDFEILQNAYAVTSKKDIQTESERVLINDFEIH